MESQVELNNQPLELRSKFRRSTSGFHGGRIIRHPGTGDVPKPKTFVWETFEYSGAFT
jgi:hypothetical protein